MAELKTRKTDASVRDFINGIDNDTRRKDARAVMRIMKRVTGSPPKMWGPGIIGYGSCKLTYETGRVADWFPVGFSPRKQNLVLYIMPGFDGYAGLMKKLGKHKTGKSCLYLNKLADVDPEVLEELIERSVEAMYAKHG